MHYRRSTGELLARYSSKNTVSAFALDLRLLFQWCAAQDLDLLDATRTHLELFARYLEDERGNGPASVHRRLSTITCFYRMAEIDNYLDRSPATHLRLPRVYRDETTTLGLDRTELGAILAAARASTPSDAALITMLGLLALLYLHPDGEYSLTDAAKHIGVTPRAVHAEASRLVAGGLILDRRVGNTRLLRAADGTPDPSADRPVGRNIRASARAHRRASFCSRRRACIYLRVLGRAVCRRDWSGAG